MQIKPAPVSCYRKPRIDETDHPEARRRLAILTKVAALRERGVSLEVALLAAEVPRSTYYRWRRALRRDGVRGLVPCSRRPRGVHRPRWTREAEQRVWALRRRYPFMGKRRLRVLLAREGLRLSESTVGRIVAKGVRRGRIQPCAFCRGRVTVKQRRRFDGHAYPARPSVGATASAPNSRANWCRSIICPRPGRASNSRSSRQSLRSASNSSRASTREGYGPQRQTLPGRCACRSATRPVIGSGRRRQRVPRGLRAGARGAADPALCAAAPPPAVQRLRRAGQRHHPGGVLESLRRRVHRRRRQPCPGRLPALPQRSPTPPGPRLLDLQRVPSQQGLPLSVPDVLNPHNPVARVEVRAQRAARPLSKAGGAHPAASARSRTRGSRSTQALPRPGRSKPPIADCKAWVTSSGEATRRKF